MSSPVPIDPVNIVGTLFIANSLNWLGLGILFIQIYQYFAAFPSDQLKVRILVWTLLVLELVQTGTSTHQTWIWCVTDFNNPAGLLIYPTTGMAVPLMAGLLGLTVQHFYAWRIWILARHKLVYALVILIVMLSIAQFAVSMYAAVVFATAASAEKLYALRPELAAWLALSLVADALVAIGMLIVLRQAQHTTIWPRTGSLLSRLILLTVGSGLALAVDGAASLGLFLNAPFGDTAQFLPSIFTLGKLYSNSALVTLNSRPSRRQPQSDDTSIAMTLRNARMRNRTDAENTAAKTKSGGEIQISVSTSSNVTTDSDIFPTKAKESTTEVASDSPVNDRKAVTLSD